MNKIKLYVLLFASIFLVACSNNENGEISVLDTYDPDSNIKEMHPDMIDNNGVDDLMGTNEQMITITIPEEK